MTDEKDNIELPPLPPVFEWASMAPTGKTIKDYARAAVLADRERRAKVAAKPVVHKARLSLADNGDWSVGGDRRPGRINILIHWTDDGRAWIDSERNRELAESLRGLGFSQSADALDGGVR